MVSHDEASRLISAWLLSQSMRTNIALDLVEQDTIETDFGWVFFYTSRRFDRE
jgi:hypothetical protein